jgi:hypothetical protein
LIIVPVLLYILAFEVQDLAQPVQMQNYWSVIKLMRASYKILFKKI